MTHISLEQANALIAGAFAHGKEAGNYPITVAVLDAGGHTIALQRQDGSANLRPRIAAGKARAALALGISGRLIGELAAAKPAVIGALSSLAPDGFVPGPGAVLIVDETGRSIGAVGVSGDTPDIDELCALAGISAAGLNVQG